MKAKRLWWTIRLALKRGAGRRGEYAKKAGVFGMVGERVRYQPRMVPIYSELIKFHNNIMVARNVDFVTHDAIHLVFNGILKENPEIAAQLDGKFHERIGCIEVMDNVFIGSNSVILYNTRIGPNVVIASGSVVTKDCEPNSVYAGCPARKIGSLDAFMLKLKQQENNGIVATTTHNQALTASEIENAWNIFRERHTDA